MVPRDAVPMSALHRRTRSAGASSSWRPRRPADTNTVGCSSAEASTTTGSGRREPSGLIPPMTPPVARSAAIGSTSVALRPRARQREALEIELPVDRDDGQDQPLVDARDERLEHAPRVDAERRRGVRPVARTTRRGRARDARATRRRGAGRRCRRVRRDRWRGSRRRSRSDRSHFGYARGGPPRSASIDAGAAGRRRAPVRCPRRDHTGATLDLRFTRPVGRPRAHGRRGGV